MKMTKMIFVVISCLIIILTMNTYTYAVGGSTDGTKDQSTSDLIKNMEPKDVMKSTDGSRLTGILAQVFSVLQYAGTGISIMMVMWLGISYMISSVEQKAEIKKKSVPILIGSVLIVGTVNVLKFLAILQATAFD